jgi:hypothetical protein
MVLCERSRGKEKRTPAGLRLKRGRAAYQIAGTESGSGDDLETARLGGLGHVLGIAESEDWIENKSEEQKAESEGGSLAEFFGDVEGEDQEDEVDEGDEAEDQPPARSAGDLEQYIKVVDRNDRGPAGLACLGVYLPQRGDHEDNNA